MDVPRASGTADAAGPGPATAPGTQAPAPAGRGAAAPAPPAAAGRGSPESPCIPAPATAALSPSRAGAPRTPAPPARPVRPRECPLLAPRAQRLPLVLPQPLRGRPAQNRGLLARIGHAPGSIPAPLPAIAHQLLAGVRAGGPHPHRLPRCQQGCRIPVQPLPPIPPPSTSVPPACSRALTPAAPMHTAGSQDCYLPWQPRSAGSHNWPSPSLPGPSPHTGTEPHRCPHARRATSSAPRVSTAWRCPPRRRRRNRSAPAAAAQCGHRAGGGPRRPAARAARGTGPAAPLRRARPGQWSSQTP